MVCIPCSGSRAFCARWVQDKAEIKPVKRADLLHGKTHHLRTQAGIGRAILGISDFAVGGLGISRHPNIGLNPILDSDWDRADLKV